MSKLKIAIHLTGIDIQLVNESKTSHEHTKDQNVSLKLWTAFVLFSFEKENI